MQHVILVSSQGENLSAKVDHPKVMKVSSKCTCYPVRQAALLAIWIVAVTMVTSPGLKV